MPIKNELGVEVALIQLGLAVNELAEAPAHVLGAATVKDPDGKVIGIEEALCRVERGLAEVRARMEGHRANLPVFSTVYADHEPSKEER